MYILMGFIDLETIEPISARLSTQIPRDSGLRLSSHVGIYVGDACRRVVYKRISFWFTKIKLYFVYNNNNF